MRVLVDDDARAGHVKDNFERAQRQGTHNVACWLAGEFAEWLSERGRSDEEDVDIFFGFGERTESGFCEHVVVWCKEVPLHVSYFA